MKLTFDQDGHVAVLSLKALLIKGAQDCGSKVRDLHMEQLGHVGHRGGGGRRRRGFRSPLQTQTSIGAESERRETKGIREEGVQ